MKVALVHDRLNIFGGSERVLEDLHSLFTDATVFTSIADYSCLPESWKEWNIKTSFLQSMSLARRHHRLFLPWMILYFEQLDLSDYDLVISSSHCAAKAVICRPDAFHICYCHSPLRYAWAPDPANYYFKKMRHGKFALSLFMHWIRMWDYCSAARVDHFIANSHHIQAKIKRYYGRESNVIYPGVDISRFKTTNDISDYYLVVSRMVPYKRLDLAVKAANKLKRRLLVVGNGPDERSLRKIAGPTVEFQGHLCDKDLVAVLSRCKALLFPGEEDFGLTPVEAQASGKPVIAYGRGGATETVIDGVTGVLFDKQTVDSLCETIIKFESMKLCPAAARKNAERFSRDIFKQAFASILDKLLLNRVASK